MDPVTLLAAFAPVVIDAGRALINRFVAAPIFKPSTIDEWVRMQEVDLERFRAVSTAGGHNPSYPWVEAIVRLQRPVIAAIVLLVWTWLHLAPIPGVDMHAVNNAAAAVWFYLFGDRTLAHIRMAQAASVSGTTTVNGNK